LLVHAGKPPCLKKASDPTGRGKKKEGKKTRGVAGQTPPSFAAPGKLKALEHTGARRQWHKGPFVVVGKSILDEGNLVPQKDPGGKEYRGKRISERDHAGLVLYSL